MWLLKNIEEDQIYKMKRSRENTVSRKDGDLILCGDQSISRKHAVLMLSENGEKVILKDLGSKYGTSVKHNDSEFKKAKANEEILLNVGDIIQFGIQSNLWKLEYFPIVVTASTLGQEEKTELRQIISALDGTVVTNWSPQCTHLVMNQLTVTVKVVCALADCRSIVTLAYFKSLHQCITTMQLPLPNVNDFVPELVEATLNPNEVSFIPNLLRKTLFSGTVFVASTLKQLARIEIMVTAAGGKVEEFVPKDGIDKYLSKGYILMMHSAIDKPSSQESEIPNGYINIAKMLKKQGVRCIPEPEIGLGILYCSMEKYCNPRFKIQILAQQKDSCEQTKEPSASIDSETQEKPHGISCSNMEIPETCSLSVNKAQSSSKNYKKRVCDKELEEAINQKRACRQQNSDEDLFASSSLQLRTSCQISESGKLHASTVRSPELFSIEKDTSISVDSSKEHSRSSDPFNFPSKNIDNAKASSSTSSLCNSSKRLNSSIDIFSSIVEKNKTRKSQDSDFTFPSEIEENQCKTKRNREEDSEFDFVSEWEGKRPKLDSVVNNKKKNENNNNSLFDNSDPFNFPTDKVESSKTTRKKTNSGHGLWHSIVNEMRSEHSSKNQKAVRDKTTDNLSSDDETNLPKLLEELKDLSFQVVFDEEVKKELPKPTPLTSFISKETIKKENTVAEEEDLAEQFNVTCKIQVKCLVITNPLQKIPPQQSPSNIVNFKKFKKKQTGMIPCIIGGSDLIPHEIY